MKIIFDVNLWWNDPPEHSIFPEGEPCASLALPAEPYELLDALEKVGLEPGVEPHWHISAYHLVNLAISEKQGSIYELDALARKLSDLDERQVLAYRGLVDLDIARNRRPAPLSLLIDMAYGTGCYRVLPEARDDRQLGRYCVENGLVPGLEGLPPELLRVLDYEGIGRKRRQAEGGVFVTEDFTRPLGYVAQDGALADAHGGLDLAPRQPDYAILLDVSGPGGRTMQLELPSGPEALAGRLAGLGVSDWSETMWDGRDCRVPCLTGKIYDYGFEKGFSGAAMAFLNRLAGKLADMGPEDLAACKALLEACGCDGIADAAPLLDMLDGYRLASRAGTPAELAEETLCAILPEEQAALLVPYLDLEGYGQALARHRGGALTSYGLLERKDGPPVRDQDAAVRDCDSQGRPSKDRA